MATIQIRNVSEETYETLREAAEAEGKSLQAFMKEQADIAARRVRKKAMLAAVDSAWKSSSRPGMTIDDINKAIRELRGD